jgi:hypothetical protein
VKGKNNIVAETLSRMPPTFSLMDVTTDWKALLLVEYSKSNLHVIAQFVVRIKGLSLVGQIGVTGTYPTQCHHDGKVLSI